MTCSSGTKPLSAAQHLHLVSLQSPSGPHRNRNARKKPKPCKEENHARNKLT